MSNSWYVRLSVLIVVLLLDYCWADYVQDGCKDESGNPTPWYILYKLPKLNDSSDQILQDGFRYYYMGPNNPGWTRSEISLNDPVSFVGQTLSKLYQNSSRAAWVIYNDHPPNQQKLCTGAHMKGIMSSTAEGGFWLLHSVPQFPIPGATYRYQEAETRRGQTFFCLTLPAPKIEEVAYVLGQVDPNVIFRIFPSDLLTQLPIMGLMSDQGNKLHPPQQLSIGLDNGFSFKVFAKSPKLHIDIYSQRVSSRLKAPIAVQSWLDGPDAFTSTCDIKYPVLNVLNMTMAGYSFASNQDHSKWAVSLDSKKPWACLADLNRRTNQLYRGGAVTCIENSELWQAFGDMITELQACGAPKVQEDENAH